MRKSVIFRVFNNVSIKTFCNERRNEIRQYIHKIVRYIYIDKLNVYRNYIGICRTY